MDPLVELKNVSKCFSLSSKRDLCVLENISLAIGPQSLIGIIGESGSGKSTLLNLVGGLDNPSSGHIFFNNCDVSALSINKKATLRKHFISFIFQSANLFPELTAIENVLFPIRIFGERVSDYKPKAKQLLEQLHIAHCAKEIPEYLSGGERQRIAIARALISRPKLIIADEPTGNLDEENASNVIQLLCALCRENHSALLLVTHNLAFTKFMDANYKIHDRHLLPY